MYTPSKLHYIIGSKYNTIVEYAEEVVVKPFSKKNYLSVCSGDTLLVFNSESGNIIRIDLDKDVQEIINLHIAHKFKGFSCFACTRDYFYFIDNFGYLIKYDTKFNFINETKLPVFPSSFTVLKNDFYLYERTLNKCYVFRFNEEIFTLVNEFELKGIGNKGFAIKNNDLWVADDEENTISIYDKETGKFKNCILTPYISPVGLGFLKDSVYVAYSGVIVSNTFDNISFPEQKPFFHKLNYKTISSKRCKYTLSNSFVVEFLYEETINLHSKDQRYNKLVVEIAIPVTNERQQLLELKPIGRNFKLIDREGKKFAQFQLGAIDRYSGGVIGYKSLMKLSGLKYLPLANPKFSEYDLSEPMLAKEVEEEESLHMWSPYIRDFSIIEKSPEIIETVKQIRNKVFKALYYRPNSWSRDLEDVIRDGYGTCGDYTNLIMSCCRLNEIPIRSRGGFKVPRFTNSQNDSLSCLDNHAWLEVFIPGLGWIPFESSSDDKEFNGRLCEGQFLGEDWTHIKTHENTSNPNFITCRDDKVEVHPYDIFENNIDFRVLGETEI
ncbi:MAG: transglutaminase domain-containing protein [Bacteroidia bacterium]|nr:transglutaminase domain-containing protein [Bacteroidia bacterium]